MTKNRTGTCELVEKERVDEPLGRKHCVIRHRTVALREIEAIAARVFGVGWIDVKHPVVEDPNNIESRCRCLRVLLITSHSRHEGAKVRVPVGVLQMGIFDVICLHHRDTVQLQVHLKSSTFLGDSVDDELTIGQVSARSGIATSALRFYEEIGLITSHRTGGNQRRYDRSVLRTVSVIRAAQEVGLSLSEIADALDALPDGRTPTKKDWSRLATRWRVELDNRINELVALRDNLGDCIGCGCLSLRSCALFNPGDSLASSGTGARLIAGKPRPATTTNGRTLSD